MDQPKKPTKRARSATPTKSGAVDIAAAIPTAKKRKTSKKKEKKSKSNSSNSGGGTPIEAKGSSIGAMAETDSITATKQVTATTTGATAAEEIMMAQMLLTFSHVEQARFAAYTRSKLPTRAVQDWITALLRDRLRQAPNSRLSDMVSTDQANDIVWTIGMAGKIFVQRLVADAIKRGSNTDNTFTIGQPGLVAVWRTALERRHNGSDPGLFLPPSSQQQQHANLHWSGHEVTFHQQARLAAEQAQEEYDKEHPVMMTEAAPSSSTIATRISTPADNNDDDDVTMITEPQSPDVATITELPHTAMEGVEPTMGA